MRDALAKDLPAVLEQVGKIGYQGVEFAGYYGRNAKDLRKLLDDNGLKCCGTHIGVDALLGEQLAGTVEFNKTIGNRNLVVASMGGDRLGSVDKIKKTAALFTELADKLKESNMRVGYHAHGGDFKKFEGETVWDMLLQQCRTRRDHADWMSATAWTAAAIPMPSSRSSPAEPRRFTSRNTAASMAPSSAKER